MDSATDEVPRSVLVLASCGCWWKESRPAGLVVPPDQPRACVRCHATHPASVGASPQGMALVRVQYLPDPDVAARRAAEVGAVADWLGQQRGQAGDGQVHAGTAERKLRTALGQHFPDGPHSCPA
ncbi:hypothetical protein AB0F93_03460 [Micromonospora tulbaghiae]|uniref:hypothetical protein n=1 Tax=Micromonospora tulbaghiae TaxID=479978 RepID=UPI003319270F